MTASERLLTNINNSIFFKEFTYSENQIFQEGGDTKELADNIVWLDDLLLVYQVKGREAQHVTDTQSEEKWFDRTIAGKAKKQIKDTINFLQTWQKLPVTNERGQMADIAQAAGQKLIKLVIFDPGSKLLEDKKNIKFLESSTAGLIHLFHIQDYEMVCECLVTPSELAEYLQFREEIYLRHKDQAIIGKEEYLLGHFFTTQDTKAINQDFLNNFGKIDNDSGHFEVGSILNNFFNKVVLYENGRETDYHFILKEIAKLNRNELMAFNSRYRETIQNVQTDKFALPLRFAVPRTGCGFVFVTMQQRNKGHWYNALLNFVDTYRYKHRLDKCIGVVMAKDGQWFDINWAFTAGKWEFNEELEQALSNEGEFYGDSELLLLPRYKLKN